MKKSVRRNSIKVLKGKCPKTCVKIVITNILLDVSIWLPYIWLIEQTIYHPKNLFYIFYETSGKWNEQSYDKRHNRCKRNLLIESNFFN